MRISGRKVKPSHIGKAVICKKALRVDGNIVAAQGAVGMLESCGWIGSNFMFVVLFEDGSKVAAHKVQLRLHEVKADTPAEPEVIDDFDAWLSGN